MEPGGKRSDVLDNQQQTSPQTGAVLVPPAEPLLLGLSARAWLIIGTITFLLASTFRFNLSRLWFKVSPLSDDLGAANWGHSLFVPIIGIYYLFLNRDELLKQPIEPLLGTRFSASRIVGGLLVIACGLFAWFVTPQLMRGALVVYLSAAGKGLCLLGGLILLLDWGLATLLFGLAVFQYGIYPGRNDWTSDMGIPLVIFGVVLTLCGWKVMRIAWFPIAFLICAIPWPPLVYSRVASPLQELAASIAVGTLNIVGIVSEQAGTKIIMERGANLPDRILNVAEACAGMRSLMTFIAVGAAMAFLSHRPLWQKFIVTLAAIPIAIFCNVMRVSGQGILDRLWSEEVSEGFAHAFVGLVMLIPAFFLLLLVQWALDQMFVEEVEGDQTPGVIKKAPAAVPGVIRAGEGISRRASTARPQAGEGA